MENQPVYRPEPLKSVLNNNNNSTGLCKICMKNKPLSIFTYML